MLFPYIYRTAFILTRKLLLETVTGHKKLGSLKVCLENSDLLYK